MYKLCHTSPLYLKIYEQILLGGDTTTVSTDLRRPACNMGEDSNGE